MTEVKKVYMINRVCYSLKKIFHFPLGRKKAGSTVRVIYYNFEFQFFHLYLLCNIIKRL